MATFKAIEKVTGQPPNNSVSVKYFTFLLSILTIPIRLLTFFNKGYSEVLDSNWEYMLTVDNFKIEKRLIAATGFDDCIHFYNLSSTDKILNETMRGKCFGNFIVKTANGIFLRQFNSPKDWPNSKLVFISFDKYQMEIVAKSNSSWVDWTYNFIDDKQIDIITEHSKDYTKVLQIRKIQVA